MLAKALLPTFPQSCIQFGSWTLQKPQCLREIRGQTRHPIPYMPFQTSQICCGHEPPRAHTLQAAHIQIYTALFQTLTVSKVMVLMNRIL